MAKRELRATLLVAAILTIVSISDAKDIYVLLREGQEHKGQRILYGRSVGNTRSVVGLRDKTGKMVVIRRANIQRVSEDFRKVYEILAAEIKDGDIPAHEELAETCAAFGYKVGALSEWGVVYAGRAKEIGSVDPRKCEGLAQWAALKGLKDEALEQWRIVYRHRLKSIRPETPSLIYS